EPPVPLVATPLAFAAAAEAVGVAVVTICPSRRRATASLPRFGSLATTSPVKSPPQDRVAVNSICAGPSREAAGKAPGRSLAEVGRHRSRAPSWRPWPRRWGERHGTLVGLAAAKKVPEDRSHRGDGHARFLADARGTNCR